MLPKALYVDVDGTLIRNGKLNQQLIDYIARKRDEGYYVALWSAQGQAYARETAEVNGVAYLFDIILPKPGIIADDHGWYWTKNCKAIKLHLLGLDIYNA